MSIFARRHYNKIAESLSHCYTDEKPMSRVLCALMAMFKEDNEDFDSDRFMKAITDKY